MYKYTALYANGIRNFKKDCKAIVQKYQGQIEQVQQFADSQAARDELARLHEKITTEVDAIREGYVKRMHSAVDSMRGEVARKLSIMPTPEQVAALQLLNMRQSVTAAEVNAMSPSLAGCPIVMQALKEVASKHKLMGLRLPADYGDPERSFTALVRNGEHLLYSFMTDRWDGSDFIDMRLEREEDDHAEVFRVFGAVTEFQEFQQLVDHPEGTDI